MSDSESRTLSGVVETQMLIRKPVAEVYNAFIDPAVTVNFWFTRSSGRLEEGETATWHWDMYGVSTQVHVKQLVPGKLIATDWGSPATSVDYEFTALAENATYVVIRCHGFRLEGDQLIAALKDNTAGFTTVLDGLKAWLEHGIRLNLVADKFPGRLTPDHRSPEDRQRNRD